MISIHNDFTKEKIRDIFIKNDVFPLDLDSTVMIEPFERGIDTFFLDETEYGDSVILNMKNVSNLDLKLTTYGEIEITII